MIKKEMTVILIIATLCSAWWWPIGQMHPKAVSYSNIIEVKEK